MASSKAKQLKKENSKLIEKLISSVTGLKKDGDSENFQIAVRYVESVFSNRPFCTFCPVDVWNKVTRIKERFQHQAEHRKTKIWMALTSTLRTVTSQNEDSLTAILFVLMELSNLRTRLPLDKDFDCDTKVSEPNVIASSAFENACRADANCLLPAYESNSEYESSTCSEESNEPMCLSAVSADSGAGNSPELELGPEFPPKAPDEPEYFLCDFELPQEDRTLPYWIQWGDKPKFVSEQTLMTEAIWMLLGNKGVFLFQWNGSRFYVREGTHLIDLSQEVLESVFSHVCECAQYFVEIQEFCKKFSNLNVPRILQAFVLSLQQSSQIVRKRLITLEKEVTDEDSSITLLILINKLRPTLSLIVTVWSVLQTGIVQRPIRVQTQCEQSLHLLSALYRATVEEDTIHGQTRFHFSLLVNIFLNTCQPFLNFMDQLLNEGQIDDPHEEFIVERFTDVTSQNCDNILVFREVPSQYREGFFLCEVLKEVVLASSLTVILKESAHWPPAQSHQSETLSAQFTCLCRKKLHLLENTEEDISVHTSTSEPTKESSTVLTIATFLSRFDPLLKANFAEIFPFPASHNENKKDEEQEPELFPDVEESLSYLLGEILSTLVNRKCEIIHRRVMDVLIGDLFIPDHLLVIRKYFLLESGDEMSFFMKKIVKTVVNGNLVASARWAVSIFDRIKSESSLKHLDLLSLTMDLDLKHQNSLEALDQFHSLHLNYSAPSPVNLILCNKSMAIYQDIFCFLMKLNCAKTSLDMLRFNDLDSVDICSSSTKAHSMFIFIFRMHLLHLIHRLHFYFFTGLLQTRQTSFSTAVDEASSFHQILNVHQDHLEDMQHFCLLSPSLLIFNRIICNILNLIICFTRAWISRTAISGIKGVVDLENDFHGHIWAFNRTSSLFLSQQASKPGFKKLQLPEFVTLCSIFSSQMLHPRPVLSIPESS